MDIGFVSEEFVGNFISKWIWTNFLITCISVVSTVKLFQL